MDERESVLKKEYEKGQSCSTLLLQALLKSSMELDGRLYGARAKPSILNYVHPVKDCH
uniref:Uncharacterized protein n=1 Tax=Utricularia reniformis TaxID=192314 RepID=A0A1Y0AZT5_9LAMI|nr:hypothetical protein AEK19_MT0390 [Utricularia reniformis]ART30660.1 hypothetical protein AEK19_MT0390 [Utricularia reniformis]